MPIQILMPALSPTMTEGTIAKWAKKEGDAVESGDVIAEIETDKATMEIEAVDEGTLGKILVPEGTEEVPVNQVIALLLEDGEDVSALEGALEGASAPAAPPVAPAPAPAKPAAAPQPTPARTANRVIASPLARRLAAEKGVNLAALTGTGPKGRIVKRDVEGATPGSAATAPAAQAAQAAPPPTPTINAADPLLGTMPEFKSVANSTMRKTIAKRLTESARDVPHFNLSVDVDLDTLLDFRKRLNAKDGADYKISVNDFIIKAVALALERVPACNASYTDEATLYYNRADISVAVAIDGGLITPVIRDVGNKGLVAISAEARALALRARAGQLQPEEYQGGTFTVSNLGMFGVTNFTSIINPPQGAILSVGAGEPRAVVRNGALAMATVMTLTMAIDHRCIDGATAAAFTKELKAILELPLQFML
ncbi:MAG: pyruvate dehydrogenase complex dihydrolipoamide acetyltransferase [Rhodospirillaceae bacterium]|jgi:pyruvate dehydrogenase E2 component (dihydrolipoamide acetyltransferase)|nr:pyruvate dehydrogenase complex dihydrolipoamide acetyltransferase [Rhodospirillaceae bacterium]|tara:strand:- start:6074 stop:7351 length:1278 start_codon:yes stop_codon:yes gene_type:complete